MYENIYPSLFQWKIDGIDKFPSIPKELIVLILQANLSKFISAYNKKRKPKSESERKPNSDYLLIDIQNSLFAALSYRFSEQKLSRVSEARDSAKKFLRYYSIGVTGKWTNKFSDDPLKRYLYLYVEYQLSQIKTKRHLMWGQQVAASREQIRRGKSRTKVLRELGKSILPVQRPGSTSFSDDDLEIIWYVYLEMQRCIKDFRSKLYFPLKVIPQEEFAGIERCYGEDSPGAFALDRIPEIDEIFKVVEIRKVLSNNSISDIAADVILNRLAKCKYRRIKIGSPRTLQNILHQVNPKILQ